MRKLVSVLFGIALTFSAIPYAVPENYKGYAHVCTATNNLCASETPMFTVVCPTGMVCAGKTSTTTSTTTATGTGTFYQTPSQPVTATVTASGGTLYGAGGIQFITATSTSTATASATVSGTGTSTGTGTLPSSQTLTFTGSQVNTGTFAFVTPVYTWTQTSTTTASHYVTVTNISTATLTNTVTVTGSATLTRTGTVSGTGSVTVTGTVTGTSGATATATVTGTQTASVVATTTQTATVSASSTFTQTGTFTASRTFATNEPGTGTGTNTYGGGNYTATGTVTNTGAVTATGTFTGSATATVTFTGSASGTTTGTVTDTSSATATTATLPTTITYVPPVVPVVVDPRGTSYLVAGVYYPLGGSASAAFVTLPAGETQSDPSLTLTAGGSIQNVFYSAQPCDPSYSASGNPCSLVNRPELATAPKWIPSGTITINLWAKATSQVNVLIQPLVMPGYGGSVGYVWITVTSASWTMYSATIPLPSGLLLPANSQLAVFISAMDSASGTPTITIGATSGHYTSINGPWVAGDRSSLSRRFVVPGVPSGTTSVTSGISTAYTYGSVQGYEDIEVTANLKNTGGSSTECSLYLYGDSSQLSNNNYTLSAGADVTAVARTQGLFLGNSISVRVGAFTGGTCAVSSPGGDVGGRFILTPTNPAVVPQ